MAAVVVCRDAAVQTDDFEVQLGFLNPLSLLKLSPVSSSRPSPMLPLAPTRHIQFDRVTLLLDAASHGEEEEVASLAGEEVNVCNQDGVTALHCAAGFGHLGVARLLLERGAHVNAMDGDGWTPLHNAAALGNLAMVRLLLEWGGNVEAEVKGGRRPDQVSNDQQVVAMLREARGRKYQASWVTALYDYQALHGDELSFAKGERFQVLNREADLNWWLAKSISTGKIGLVPRQFVQ